MKQVHPTLFMNNYDIQEVHCHKHLGIYFYKDGMWYDHINYIVKKAYTRINILRKFRLCLDRHVLEKIYLSFIRPLLEYGDVIWDNTNKSLVNKIENVQIEAMRIVTGGTKLTSIEKLYKETGWESLSDRRETHKLILFYKMINFETPDYLRELVPSSIGNTHTHYTRQSQNIIEVGTRTNFYSEYFLPSTIKLWNRLPLYTRNSTSLNIFKQRISKRVIKPPDYYYLGTRLGQVLHTRLRLGSSSLNEHLYVRNLVDSPNCTCGQVETSSHFLLNCTKYDTIREELILSIPFSIPIDSHLLLFGSNLLNTIQNKEIFLKVQKFILKRKRFVTSLEK